MGDITYSYSRMDTYEQCPFKYFLQYEDGHYLFTNSAATEVGTLIHETEEAIAKSLQAKQKPDYIALKNNIIYKLFELRHKYPTDFATADKSGRFYFEKVYDYLRTGIYALEQYMSEHPTYEIVGIEQEFLVNYAAGKTFKGFIDRVFKDTTTNKYIIQDIKTYPVPVDKQHLTTPLQFVVYVLAWTAMTGCSVADISCQYYLPFCHITQDAGTAGFIDRGKAKLDKLFDHIDQKDFQPKPTPLCAWCQFSISNPDAPEEGKQLCPYYCLWDRNSRNRADCGKVNRIWDGLEAYREYEKQLAKTAETVV